MDNVVAKETEERSSDAEQIGIAAGNTDAGHKALCPASRPQNPGIMLDDGAGIHAWYMQ